MTLRRAWRFTRTLFAWAALAIGLYFLAALTGSLVGTNNDWREPDTGVTIYVETNGVHTALVLPAENEFHNWSAMLPPEHLADPRYGGPWLSFSWGNRRFYLETESWADVKASTLLHAAGGSSETLVHIYHYQRPWVGKYMRKLVISEAQYRELVELLRARFADPDNPQPIRGYGPDDVFYEGTGRYTLLNTCNNWTARTLSAIGVRTGVWTPFAGGVMRWFPEEGV